MVPWPIGVIAAVHAVFATVAAAAVWRVGMSHALSASSAWSSLWCLSSSALTVGLVFLKPWARRFAVYASIALAIGGLAVAALAVLGAPPDPARSLCGTGFASAQLVIIRYLTRPRVKAWFGELGLKSHV